MNDKPSIVMKLGAEKCEVGLGCDSAPRAQIRTLVGRPNAKVESQKSQNSLKHLNNLGFKIFKNITIRPFIKILFI